MRERGPTENPKLTTGIADFFGHGRGAAIQLVGIMLALTAASTALLVHTVGVRLRRDVARLVLEDRLEVLDSVRWRVASSEQMLRDAVRHVDEVAAAARLSEQLGRRVAHQHAAPDEDGARAQGRDRGAHQ